MAKRYYVENSKVITTLNLMTPKNLLSCFKTRLESNMDGKITHSCMEILRKKGYRKEVKQIIKNTKPLSENENLSLYT